MTNPFDSPATASGIDLHSLKGALLIVTVHSHELGIKTAYGESDAIRCDVDVVDGDSAGTTFDNTLLFPKVLQSQLRPKVGGKVIGRLGQGQQKPGQSPPWMLIEATPADVEAGKAYLNRTALTSATAPPF